MENPIPKELLGVLACPRCMGDLRYDGPGKGLVCLKCRLLYEIRDGIPILLEDEAKPLEEGGGHVPAGG